MRVDIGELACLEFCRHEARTVTEIEKHLLVVGVEFAPKRIYGFLNSLEKRALLQAEIYGAAPADQRPFHSPPYRRRYYRATEESLLLTQAAYDTFVAIFSDTRPSASTTTCNGGSTPHGTVTVRTLNDIKAKKSTRRLPDADELQKLLSNANREFAVFYKFWSQSDLPFDLAAKVEIEDFDWNHQCVASHRISGSSHPIAFQSLNHAIQANPELWRLIEQAASGRQSGPVFTTGIGTAWASDSARVYFNRAREKAQIPKDVVMQGHRRLGYSVDGVS